MNIFIYVVLSKDNLQSYLFTSTKPFVLRIIEKPLLILLRVHVTGALLIMVLLQGLCYVVDITMVFLTFIGIFDFVFHLVELSRVDERGLLLLNLPYRIDQVETDTATLMVKIIELTILPGGISVMVEI